MNIYIYTYKYIRTYTYTSASTFKHTCKSLLLTIHTYTQLFGGEKIEDREVNSLFDSKESYSGSIILLEERGDIQA